MPVVTVEMWAGRTVEQKKALIADITKAMITHANVKPTHLHVIIYDVEKENWGRGGVIASELD